MKPGNIPTVSTGAPAKPRYSVDDVLVGFDDEDREYRLDSTGNTLAELYDNATITLVWEGRNGDDYSQQGDGPDDYSESVRVACLDAFEAAIERAALKSMARSA